MNAELIAVGTELLLGEISNTDGQYISERLSEIGVNVFYHTVVGDNPGRLAGVLKTALSRSDLVITTGGLGPTYDDLTKETIASVLGLPLVHDEESLARMEAHFTKSGRKMTENNKKQALMPLGAVIFRNNYGTAPGCAVEKDGKIVAMLPGPPRECGPMVDERLLPYLAAREDGGVIASSRLRIFGIGESEVESRLCGLMETAQNPTVAPYAKEGEVMLRITSKAPSRAQAEAMIGPVAEKIREILGGYVYGADVNSLEHALALTLARKGLTVGFAESCTGGLAAKRLTDIPGASDVFLGGAVTYSNESKVRLLGVPPRVILKYGAVSAECAVHMARGAAKVFGSDIAVSITGIAGPGGGTAEKPVGLVFVGLCLRGVTTVKRLELGSPNRDRAYIRALAASHALKLALNAAENA